MTFVSKNGALFLLMLLFIFHFPAKADSYPLSPESKTKIAIVSAIGGLIGGGLGYAAYCNDYAKKPKAHNAKKSMWSKMAPLLGYVMIPATLGAAACGLITYYCFTPEKTQEWCENTLKKYEFELKDIESCSDINQLKKMHYNSRFPTVATFDHLDALNHTLLRVREYLIGIIQSGIKPLVAAAEICLQKIDRYQKALVDRLISLKNDPIYLKELLVRAEIRMMNDIASSQREMAQAASMHAHAAMVQAQAALIKAHNQKPPVVVVHTRN